MDKENNAPAYPDIYYPELPPLSPLKRQTPDDVHNPPPKKQQSRQPLANQQQRTPANTSRRRTAARVGYLGSTPPRSSYAEQVRGIFKPTTREHASSTASSSTTSMTSASELERKLMALPRTTSSDLERFTKFSSASSMYADTVPQAPPGSPQEFQQQADSTSTDSWTGDEVFIPRSQRRQSRRRQQCGDKYETQGRSPLKHGVASDATMALRQIQNASRDRETRALSGRRPVNLEKVAKLKRGCEQWEEFARYDPDPAATDLINNRPSDGDDELDSDDPDD